MTPLDALVDALVTTADFNAAAEARPEAVLWCDAKGEFDALLPLLRERLPQLLTFGRWDPATRSGPALWLRAAAAGAWEGGPPIAAGAVPVIYVPGVSREALKPSPDPDPLLLPLVWWSVAGRVFGHVNGKDWTLRGFLAAERGPLRLDIPDDAMTRESLARAALAFFTRPLETLRDRRLDADALDEMAAPDVIADMLDWMDARLDPEREPARFKAFASRSVKALGFDPRKLGRADAAHRLTARKGEWARVWTRFETGSGRDHPGVVKLLRVEEPPADLFADPVAHPLANTRGETSLRDALRAVGLLDAAAAAIPLGELEDDHRWRRETVWARLGEAPLAFALEHLTTVALAPAWPAADSTGLASFHAAHGWRADDGALQALAAAKRDEDRAAVTVAVRAVYAPWLEAGACALQAAGVVRSPALAAADPGEAIVFVDGLRLDLAHRLLDRLVQEGLDPQLDWRWAGVPTSTMTCKPLVSPVADRLTGDADALELRPSTPKGKPADHTALKALMAAEGWAFTDDAAPTARLWLELGHFDEDGHKLHARMVDGLDQEIANVAACLVRLVRAGRRVRVVTDHGWLLLPGGLEKAALDPNLAEADGKRTRSARLKPGAKSHNRHAAWTWNAEVQVALATGARAFFACEYAHGGVSPQECVIPVITLAPVAALASTARIVSATWSRLRLRVKVEDGAGLRIDLRAGQETSGPSIALKLGELDAAGSASLLADDAQDGRAAQLVVIDADDRIRARREVVVGVD